MAALTHRRLGRRLTRLRIAARKKPADVESAQICSRRTLKRIETAEVVPGWPVVQELSRLYGATPNQMISLVQMAKDAANQTVHSEKYNGFVHGFSLLPELEDDARQISVYESELWPGFLQPTGYAREVLQSNILSDQSQLDVNVTTRVSRREALLSGTANVRVLITEGALRRRVGGERFTGYVDELKAFVRGAPHVDVRVIPTADGSYAAAVGPFELLTFEDPLDPTVVYVETLSGADYLEDAATVTRYTDVFDACHAASTPLREWDQW